MVNCGSEEGIRVITSEQRNVNSEHAQVIHGPRWNFGGLTVSGHSLQPIVLSECAALPVEDRALQDDTILKVVE